MNGSCHRVNASGAAAIFSITFKSIFITFALNMTRNIDGDPKKCIIEWESDPSAPCFSKHATFSVVSPHSKYYSWHLCIAHK